MSWKINASRACLALILLCAGLARGQAQTPRHPLGVYAHVSLEDAIEAYKKSGSSEGEHRWLRGLYGGLFLNNPGLAGITFGIHWDQIQVDDPDCVFLHNCKPGADENGNDWDYMEDVFAAATAAGRKVQLIITPGVDSPNWLLGRLSSCDSLFTPATLPPGKDCGKVTFSKFPEQSHADGNIMPLPWSRTYEFWWWRFLAQVNDRYRFNTTFVSISVAGPICASPEMILPTTLNNSLQLSGLAADKAWKALIKNAFPDADQDFRDSDQVFIDHWNQTIDKFVNIFKDVTLVLTPDSGDDFPEFNDDAPSHPGWLFALDCAKATDYPMSCDAKTKVIEHFLAADAKAAKATQVGGMTAASALIPGRDGIGIGGIKLLAAGTADSAPILGGAEFDHAVWDPATTQSEGCPYASGCPPPPLTVEEAAYNVFKVFFDRTEFAGDYGGRAGPEPAPMQWVDLDYGDIVYAQENPNPTLPTTVPCALSLQELIDEASWNLYTISNQAPLVAAPKLPPSCQ